MKRRLPWFVGLLTGALVALPGCLLPKPDVTFDQDLAHFETVATQVEYPNVQAPSDEGVTCDLEPRTLADPEPEYWDMTLQEAVRQALTTSDVVRNLGGAVFRTPEAIQTAYGPAIEESDPQFGVEAALSAFDAEFSTSCFFEQNDNRGNNQFVGDVGIFQQDYDIFEAQLSKRAATGSQFAVRKNIEYDKNSNLGNEFPFGAWSVSLEAEARHPLLQGGGLNFNRIAGPGGAPGSMNGVLIARINTDVSLAAFEAGMRDFINEVETAYWQLYFAYRRLDAQVRARDTALETWRRVHALYLAGRRGGEAEKEAQAREQYFRFQEEVQNALAGRPGGGANLGQFGDPSMSSPSSGVLLYERGLRYLIGLPPTGDRLIRPADEPPRSPVVFQWQEIAGEALVRRPELRRKRWLVKRRELELIASRNFLLPNLDLVGRYRWRGFGKDLIDASGNPEYLPGDTASERSWKHYHNAFTNLTDGEFQEWQLGVEFSVPIGFRQGHAAVRNAELRLAEARAVLREQERLVLNFLSTAYAELVRAYTDMQTKYNRAFAAKQQLDAVQAAYDDDKVEFFVVLDAQRRYAEAEIAYHASEVFYAIALKDLHYHKGSLLAYCGVALAEGPWPSKAYRDAAELDRLRGRELPINYTFNNPPIVSQGP